MTVSVTTDEHGVDNDIDFIARPSFVRLTVRLSASRASAAADDDGGVLCLGAGATITSPIC